MPSEQHRPHARPKTRKGSVEKIVPQQQVPTEDQIRRRAYEIFVARGCRVGSPESDWRQAELELRARIALLGEA